MTATPASLALLILLSLFFLHILWRLIASRDGTAIASFVASFFILAIALQRSQPPFLLAPILLPFIYAYSWLGICAVLWSACNMRVSRRSLAFPSKSPRLTALCASQLAIHSGILAFSPWLEWRPLAIYIMAPPLMVLVSYASYRLLLFVSLRNSRNAIPWSIWGGTCLLTPLALIALEHWLAPLLLSVS